MTGKPSGSGRKKIPLARIESRSRRDVTFSKRRAGVFNKAAELSAMCGVDVGIILFSATGKAFSFGSPDVRTVTGRLMTGGGGGNSGARGDVGDQEEVLSGSLVEIEEELAAEKQRGEAFDATRRRMVVENGGLFDAATVEEMSRLVDAMEALKTRLVEHSHEAEAAAALAILGGAAAMTALAGGADFFVAGSSSATPNINLYGGAPGFGAED